MEDIAERRLLEASIQNEKEFAENIVQTLREPLLVLDSELKVITANRSFYDTFKVTPEETIGSFIYNLGNRQWDIPKLRVLLEDILPSATVFNDYEVEHDFLDIGRKIILLNAREIFREKIGSNIILLAMEDITERKQLEEKVRQLAFYDTLTNLPNRRLLNDRLSQTMAASKRSGCYAALMFLDLDNFKPLNDRYGHVVGDLLLIEAASRLKGCLRQIDTAARFGGDEFVVMLSDLNADRTKSTSQATIVAEKIRTILSAPYLLTSKNDGQVGVTIEHNCTASIGMVVFKDNEASQDDILRWADAAMYEAKKAGRNLIEIHQAVA